jgi:hypothetical protein
MSFVSVISRETFLCVMSDGLVTGPDRKTIVQEDYQKFIPLLDSRAYVAYTGTKDLCERILGNLQFVNRNFKGWREVFHEIFVDWSLSEFLNESGFVFQLSFGGLNEENEIECFSINAKNNEELHYVPKGDDFAMMFLTNTSFEDNFWQPKMSEFLVGMDINVPSNIVSAQKQLNNYIADRDATVNKKTFRMVIKKATS